MSVQYKEFSFISEFDNLEISAMSIIPEGEIKGIFQIVHGMCEYKERYYDFMNYLAGKGYVTVIHDNRGHGKSIQADGGLGYMCEDGNVGLVEDAHQVTMMVKDDFKVEKQGIPYILFGHSMGSLIARAYVKKYDSEIDKLVISGCPAKPHFMKAGETIVDVMMKKKGPKEHSKLLDDLVVNNMYDRKFKDENIIHAWINSDRAAVEKYNNDPLCNYTFTINGYYELIKLTKNVYDKHNWAVANKDMPILFLSGKDDPCHGTLKDFGKAVHLMKTVGYTNVKAGLYKGMRHEILNEPGRKRVYLDIYNFISK